MARPRDRPVYNFQQRSSFQEPMDSRKSSSSSRSVFIMSGLRWRSKSRNKSVSEDELQRPRTFRARNRQTMTFGDLDTVALTTGSSVTSVQSGEVPVLAAVVTHALLDAKFDVVDKVDAGTVVADVASHSKSTSRDNTFLMPQKIHARSMSSGVVGSPKWAPDGGLSSPTRRTSAPEIRLPQLKFIANSAEEYLPEDPYAGGLKQPVSKSEARDERSPDVDKCAPNKRVSRSYQMVIVVSCSVERH